MFILLTIAIFILKFLAVGVVGLFFLEDLELTSSANTAIYTIYLVLGCICFFSLLFFALGKKLMWLIVCCVTGFLYLGMYNSAPSIAEIHQKHNLKSRYFKDSTTFINRMGDVIKIIQKQKS
ncbi:MAG: hypothetical protein IJZ30_04030 [Alphaproteobacteria bacterium]|nr:hypothetical protein [Alphaproteobacteria bacterium]